MAKYNLFIDGTEVPEAGRAKKDAVIKIGEATGKSFSVRTDKGSEVYAIAVESEVADSGEPEVEDLIGGDGVEETEDETVFYEQIDFPGNYSIVLAPSAVSMAETLGVPAKSETFKGKLNRRVHFGGDDMDRAKSVRDLVSDTYTESLEVLHAWQKDNIEKRRGLTDMEKFLQHRDVIAKHFAKVARKVKKEGTL